MVGYGRFVYSPRVWWVFASWTVWSDSRKVSASFPWDRKTSRFHNREIKSASVFITKCLQSEIHEYFISKIPFFFVFCPEHNIDISCTSSLARKSMKITLLRCLLNFKEKITPIYSSLQIPWIFFLRGKVMWHLGLVFLINLSLRF